MKLNFYNQIREEVMCDNFALLTRITCRKSQMIATRVNSLPVPKQAKKKKGPKWKIELRE